MRVLKKAAKRYWKKQKARPKGVYDDDDDDVYRYNIRWRLKLEGEPGNMGVCTKERKGVA